MGQEFGYSRGKEGVGGSSEGNDEPITGRGAMDGTKPITDRESKMVMLRGERGDKVDIVDVVNKIRDEAIIPNRVEILRRVPTYYGTELLLKTLDETIDSQYLITAPGPDAFLFLWASNCDSDGFRKSWYKSAEIKAAFTDGLPEYTICASCGEPIQSFEHERLAAIDQCTDLKS
jgi:hypothetical protein